MEQRESLRELEDVISNSIFELKRVHEVAMVYILLGVAESGKVGAPSISKCLGKHKVRTIREKPQYDCDLSSQQSCG